MLGHKNAAFGKVQQVIFVAHMKCRTATDARKGHRTSSTRIGQPLTGGGAT